MPSLPRLRSRRRPASADQASPEIPERRSRMTSTNTLTSPIAGAEARTMDVPGATLTYDVRRSETTTEPPLVLIGSPMGAGGFPSLAAHFPDRTIVSLDPRNNGERSPAHDPSAPITPEVGADDVHRVIEAVGGGPVDLFGSSGGAVL